MVELEGGAGCVLYPRRRGGGQCDPVVRRRRRSPAGHGLGVRTDRDFCTHILGRMNVSTTYFDPLIGADIATLIQPNTRVVFLESPAPSPRKCRTFRRWCRPFAP